MAHTVNPGIAGSLGPFKGLVSQLYLVAINSIWLGPRVESLGYWALSTFDASPKGTNVMPST